MTSVEAAPNPVPRRVIRAWQMWDFGQQSFNTVILTFVFSVYLTGTVAADEDHGTAVFADAQTWAGLAVALLAPALGSVGDKVRGSRVMLTAATAATIACMAVLWWVKPSDSFLLYGAVMIAVASVFSELAGVFYNSMLQRISTPQTVGRISGTAWGLGYIGGVLALVVSIVFIQNPELVGLPTENAINVRAIALLCAGWFLVFGLPLLLLAPQDPDEADRERLTLATVRRAYVDVAKRVVSLWRSERSLLHFLLASAVYRDGLSGVFAFAGVLAANAYGFSPTLVIIFGVAANLIAGIGTWLGGKLDDVLGARRVIFGSLVAILALGGIIIASDATIVFWVAGLAIAALVGPIQSASRSMLTRATGTGGASENFGLYALTGRAVSFLSPALFGFFVRVTEDSRLGIIGVVVVLGVGLGLFALMPFTARHQPGQANSAAWQ